MNEIEIRTQAQYNQAKIQYSGQEFDDWTGKYFIASGLQPPCDLGVICSNMWIGIKELSKSRDNLTYFLVVGDKSKFTFDEFKATISTLRPNENI